MASISSNRPLAARLGFLSLMAGLALLGRGALPGLALTPVADGFTSPIALAAFNDNSGRMLVADQSGVIYLIDAGGKRLEKPFLDLRSRLAKINAGFDERGLLGLVLHPKFETTRKFFVHYSAPLRKEGPSGWDHTSIVSEFKAPGMAEADPASERIVLQIDQPYFNHNSGRLAFGPDGFLYIGVGDGGNANDVGRGHSPQGNGQDPQTLLGKILRIDVDKGNPYEIPKDNPFAAGKGKPEVFAYGFRNPWGISFDRGGERQLFAADVGQNRFEEINLVIKGGNYGWNIREGLECFDPKSPNRAPEDCPKVGASGEPLIDPIVAYKNLKAFPKAGEGLGTSVTGGYVYRGRAIPELAGAYVFADWSRVWVKPDGVLFVARRGKNSAWTMEAVTLSGKTGTSLDAYVVALGEDAAGELYLLTNDSNGVAGATGKVLKLVRAGN